MKYLLSFSMICFTATAFCQQQPEPDSIKAYIKYVDELEDIDNKHVTRSISEGSITRVNALVSKEQPQDTVWQKASGAFSLQTIHNIQADTVYRIQYHDNIDDNFYKIYYYKNNQLVAARISVVINMSGPTLYFKEEHYKDGRITYVSPVTDKLGTDNKGRVYFSIYEDGNDALKKFLNDHKGRRYPDKSGKK